MDILMVLNASLNSSCSEASSVALMSFSKLILLNVFESALIYSPHCFPLDSSDSNAQQQQ